MKILDSLGFGSERVPMIMQSESSECGLACLAMISSWCGHRIDLASLRIRFPLSLKGVTLSGLIDCADRLMLCSRPLRLDVEEIGELSLPCILHWDMSHFVVLVKVCNARVVIHDPAIGRRVIKLKEFSKYFTGVALEINPMPGFKSYNEERKISVGTLIGDISGWRSALATVLIMAMIMEIFAFAGPLFNQWMVDEVFNGADKELLDVLVCGFFLMLLMQTSIGLARGWTVMYFSTHFNIQWSANVFTHLLKLPMAWFEKRHLGDIVSRFGSIDAIQRTLTVGFIESALDSLFCVVFIIVMITYSVELTIVVIAAILSYVFLRMLLFRPLKEASEEELVLNSQEQSFFLESIRGVQAIKIFGRELDRRSRWLNLVAAAVNRGVRTQKLNLSFSIASTIIFGVEGLAIFWLGGKKVIDNEFTVGALFAFSAYASQFCSRSGSLVDTVMEFKMLSVHATRLADIVLENVERNDMAKISTDGLLPSIELENIGFRYADGEPWIVRNVNLSFLPGESVALAGPSGCGKTTLIKIILGILEPVEGIVKFGGVPLKFLDTQSYRKAFSSVMQEDHVFNGSLASNISFFDTEINVERIEHCARLAALDEDISLMPMRYHTLVGDMGTTLSGGQKQRLLLARALYKAPSVLVLDEATSHLDVTREKQVNENIAGLKITRISVAHRKETIAMCERIIQLQAGQIVSDSKVFEGVKDNHC